jgi:hypothetical protein
MAAVGREEGSDEGPGAEKRGWCGCEIPVGAGLVSEDSMALRWGVERVWENSREEVCTRYPTEKRWRTALGECQTHCWHG